VISKNKAERDVVLPPPPPLRKNPTDSRENQGPTVARVEEDDIFVGDGVDYVVPGKDETQSPLSEDMEESPRIKEKTSYFTEPAYGPVPPTETALPPEWQEPVCQSIIANNFSYIELNTCLNLTR
jgi:IK cytokine